MRYSCYGADRDRCIRDVSWHPFENYIVSTSVRIFLIDHRIDLFYLVG